MVWCEKCHGVSPDASHSCVHCAAPFGKDCPRCGDWRAWKRWSHETRCAHHHELVCNLCHLDAHIQAHLPITDELRRLNDMEPELEIVLRNLLEDERQRASGADETRKSELRYFIAERESELASDDLIQVFNDHITELPEESQPKSELEKYRLFPKWESDFKQGLAEWKNELDNLESKSLDGRLIYNNARARVLQALESVAQETGLLPRTTPNRRASPAQNQLAENSNPLEPGEKF